jgi:aspartyl-tRNA(Asn)/glutamyl-tRNA(Gln) amidotransferase subunit A
MTTFLTIAEATKLIAAKNISPVELTQNCLDRISRADVNVHSFLLVTEERALADARAAEARVMRKEMRGPLDGIPIGHKDVYNTAGVRTTAHSKLLQHNVPTADATAVRKLAEAGSVMMGKLATHEFAIGGHAYDLPWPSACNPWNPDHLTGGSSSGTGAAVAAGFVLGGTGSDTAGSIRGPAALCGIAGIKPTYGRVSRAGILPLSFTLDHAGPMAWTVEDCAIMLQSMAGYDADDPASATQPVPDFRADLHSGVRGLRLGVVRKFHESDMRASVATRQGIDDAIEIYSRLGAAVREVTLPPLIEYDACNRVIWLSEAYAVHEPWMIRSRDDYSEIFRNRVSLGAFIRASDYVQAIRRRRELCAETRAAMVEVDLLITASQPTEAPRIVDQSTWGLIEKPGFASPANVTGYPAMSVCTGFGAGGLPVAMQLIGRPFEESTVFSAAHAYEQATSWRSMRPALAQAAA